MTMPVPNINADRFSRLLIIGVICGILSPHAIAVSEDAASEFAFIRQTGFQHEVNVSLKLIQVYVTDKKGFQVTGLSKNDFILYDNGQEMKLTEFEAHEAAVVQTPQPIQRTPLLKRKLFIVFDFAYADPQGILMARNKAIHFLESSLQSSDEVGVLSFEGTRSLRVHEFLSGDRSGLRSP
jgi:VWFA-related protein